MAENSLKDKKGARQCTSGQIHPSLNTVPLCPMLGMRGAGVEGRELAFIEYHILNPHLVGR